jgi:hypothetical protein
MEIKMKKASQVLFVLILTVAVMYGFTTVTGMNLKNSVINSTTIGATTPSSGIFTSVQVNSGLLVNAGVNNTGTGFKHVRVASCTTTAVANNFCNTTVTWPAPAFADTNYTYGCSSDGNGAAAYQTTSSGSKTASNFVAVVINTPGNSAATSVTLNCWAYHD